MTGFSKCPSLSKYNLSTYACPSQYKNHGPKYQLPLANDTAATVGSSNKTRKDECERLVKERRHGKKGVALLKYAQLCRVHRSTYCLLPTCQALYELFYGYHLINSHHLRSQVIEFCSFLKTLAIIHQN